MWYVVIRMGFFKLGTKKQKQSSINGYQGVSRWPSQRNHRSTCKTISVPTAKNSRNCYAFFLNLPATVPNNIQTSIKSEKIPDINFLI